MSVGRRIAVFDLDGTLVDSLDDLAAGLTGALGRWDRRAVTPADVRRWIGDGARQLVERALADTGGPLDDVQTAEVVRVFLEDYEFRAVVHTRPYPGIPEALGRLRAAGWTLAVCTNKPRRSTRFVLDGTDLAAWFGDAVLAGDDLPVKKPHPAHLHAAIAAAGHGDAVMIGDSANDLDVARNAGVPFLGVSWGYADLRTLGAERIVDDAAALAEALVQWS